METTPVAAASTTAYPGKKTPEDNSDVRFKEASAVCQFQPYVWTVSPEVVHQFCYRCGLDPETLGKVKRCSGCQYAHYCSKECQTADWKERHKLECKILFQSNKNILVTEPSREFTLLLFAALARLAKELDAGTRQSDLLRLSLRKEFLEVQSFWHGPELMLKIYENILTLCDPKQLYVKTDDSGPHAWRFLAGVVSQFRRPMYSRIGDPVTGQIQITGSIGAEVHAFPVDLTEGCVCNVVTACPLWTKHSPPLLAMTAVRDIKINESIVLGRPASYSTLKKRTEIYALDCFSCECKACTDPIFQAEQCALKCISCNCDHPIPLDDRAKLPCPACGTNNSQRMKDAKPLITELDKWLSQRNSPVPDFDVVREQIRRAIELLHPTNLLLGLACQNATRYLRQSGRDCLPEYIPWLKQIIPSIENHKNKYDPITSLVYYDIVAAYVKKGKHRDAKKYMDVVIQRFERIFSEENDILKVNRLIHVELGRRQPDIAMILQMLWSLNVRRMSGEQ